MLQIVATGPCSAAVPKYKPLSSLKINFRLAKCSNQHWSRNKCQQFLFLFFTFKGLFKGRAETM